MVFCIYVIYTYACLCICHVYFNVFSIQVNICAFYVYFVCARIGMYLPQCMYMCVCVYVWVSLPLHDGEISKTNTQIGHGYLLSSLPN